MAIKTSNALQRTALGAAAGVGATFLMQAMMKASPKLIPGGEPPLREDAGDYLSTWKLKSIISKYSDHISLPILMRKEEWKEGEDGKEKSGKDLSPSERESLYSKLKDAVSNLLAKNRQDDKSGQQGQKQPQQPNKRDPEAKPARHELERIHGVVRLKPRPTDHGEKSTQPDDRGKHDRSQAPAAGRIHHRDRV